MPKIIDKKIKLFSLLKRLDKADSPEVSLIEEISKELEVLKASIPKDVDLSEQNNNLEVLQTKYLSLSDTITSLQEAITSTSNELKINDEITDTKLKELTDNIKKTGKDLRDELKALRLEAQQWSSRGGSANRQIALNSIITAKKYTDINLIGTGITITSADNNVTKKTDISFAAAAGGVSSVSNTDGTLNISPTTGAVIASLNLGHANIWTNTQQITKGDHTVILADTTTPFTLSAFNTNTNLGIGVNYGGYALNVFGLSQFSGNIISGGTIELDTFTPGSVLFLNGSKQITQDNAHLFWDDTNNRLGIGTNTPDTQLSVITASNTTTGHFENSGQQVYTTEGSTGSILHGQDAASAFFFGGANGAGLLVGDFVTGYSITLDDYSNGYVINANSGQFVVTGTGNVGIGNASPNTPLSFGASLGQKISLYDNGVNPSYGFGVQSGLFQIYAGGGGHIGLGLGYSQSFTNLLDVSSSGVGVGTDTPRAQLNLTNGDTSSSFAIAQMALSYVGTNQYSNFIHTRHNAGTSLNNAIDFYTSDGTANGVFPTNAILGLTISAGSVGIGTASPQSLLQVGEPGSTSGILTLAGSSANYVQVASPVSPNNWRLTLPSTQGSAGLFLQMIDAFGTTDWVAAPGSPGGSSNDIQYNNGSGFGGITGTSATIGVGLTGLTIDRGIITSTTTVTPVADGTYTVGLGLTQNGTITTQSGLIVAVQQAM